MKTTQLLALCLTLSASCVTYETDPAPTEGCTTQACECLPKTCAELSASCGDLADGCGGTLECGTCTVPETCGGGGTANVCDATCTPTDCLSQGAECGEVDDGCAATLQCGSCTTPNICGGAGTDNECGEPESPRVLQHTAWADLLAEYTSTSDDGQFVYLDYDRLAATDSTALTHYITSLGSRELDGMSQSERLAFWLNAYNATVVRGVLDRYDGDASYRVNGLFFLFFNTVSSSLGGTTLTLNQIEHGVVRGDTNHSSVRLASSSTRASIASLHDQLWDGSTFDPRIHVALNCASLSCPNLNPTAPHAFEAFVLEQQLSTLSRAFCNANKGASAGGISELFDWYGSDFDDAFGSVDGFIQEYRDGGVTGIDTASYVDYDWSLNIKP